MVEDMLSISDDESLDPNSRRIRVDTRKWIAAKLKPKVWGDSLNLNNNLTLNQVVVMPGTRTADRPYIDAEVVESDE